MYFLFAGCILGSAYFIFKLVRFYQPQHDDTYHNFRKFLTFYAALSLIFVSITLFYGIVNIRDFGKGLKERSITYIMISSVTKKWENATNIDLVINWERRVFG